MNIIAKILIIFFLTFLSTQTIVSLVDKKGDISFFYDNTETEDFQKDLKTEFIFNPFHFIVFNPQKKSSRILSFNLRKLDTISMSIVIPPPDSI